MPPTLVGAEWPEVPMDATAEPNDRGRIHYATINPPFGSNKLLRKYLSR